MENNGGIYFANDIIFCYSSPAKTFLAAALRACTLFPSASCKTTGRGGSIVPAMLTEAFTAVLRHYSTKQNRYFTENNNNNHQI